MIRSRVTTPVPRRSHPELINYEVLLVPIGGFDARPDGMRRWGPDHAAYRRSPQFKAYIRDAGVYDYWREHGFPPRCTPLGDDDFRCN